MEQIIDHAGTSDNNQVCAANHFSDWALNLNLTQNFLFCSSYCVSTWCSRTFGPLQQPSTVCWMHECWCSININQNKSNECKVVYGYVRSQHVLLLLYYYKTLFLYNLTCTTTQSRNCDIATLIKKKKIKYQIYFSGNRYNKEAFPVYWPAPELFTVYTKCL